MSNVSRISSDVGHGVAIASPSDLRALFHEWVQWGKAFEIRYDKKYLDIRKATYSEFYVQQKGAIHSRHLADIDVRSHAALYFLRESPSVISEWVLNGAQGSSSCWDEGLIREIESATSRGTHLLKFDSEVKQSPAIRTLGDADRRVWKTSPAQNLWNHISDIVSRTGNVAGASTRILCRSADAKNVSDFYFAIFIDLDSVNYYFPGPGWILTLDQGQMTAVPVAWFEKLFLLGHHGSKSTLEMTHYHQT